MLKGNVDAVLYFTFAYVYNFLCQIGTLVVCECVSFMFVAYTCAILSSTVVRRTHLRTYIIYTHGYSIGAWERFF